MTAWAINCNKGFRQFDFLQHILVEWEPLFWFAHQFKHSMQVSTRQQNQTYGIIALWFCLLYPKIMKWTLATFLPIINHFEVFTLRLILYL